MSDTLFHFELEFLSYWHAGTGQAGAGDVDAVVLRDQNELPYFPGKALKGLFSEACCSLIAAGEMTVPQMLSLFGRENGDSLRTGARLRFANAKLPESEATPLVANQIQDGLIEILASTALEDSLAVSRTLRRIEVAIPITLSFSISLRPGNDSEDSLLIDDVEKLLQCAAEIIAMAGAHRHAGLGECRVKFLRREEVPDIISNVETSAEPKQQRGDLLRLPFEIELIEEVILGETPATTGSHECLDYLTGASLLGAFAASHYGNVAAFGTDAAFQVFHAGAVRFGDAYPLDATDQPSIPLPLSWHHFKNEPIFDEDTRDLRADRITDLSISERVEGKQYEQARGQWLGTDARRVSVNHRRLLKSARDTANFGRPAENQLFSYQALQAGQRFGGEIQVRTDLVPANAITLLRQWLNAAPTLTLGRSRSAEFGAVHLRPAASFSSFTHAQRGSLLLYALSDICPHGPELLPADGGEWHDVLHGWRINLRRTHARVREYANWNGWRACPDPARRVVTRGSVIAFDPPSSDAVPHADLQHTFDRDGIGGGLQHGLGRVLVNPAFPSHPINVEESLPAGQKGESSNISNSTLLHAARRRFNARKLDLAIDDIADLWVKDWRRYDKRPSPSQWSRLRQMAAASSSLEHFKQQLEELLNHGAAKKAWGGAKKGNESLADVIRKLATDPGSWPSQVKEARKTEHSSGERLLLNAIAETARQMRQTAKT